MPSTRSGRSSTGSNNRGGGRGAGRGRARSDRRNARVTNAHDTSNTPASAPMRSNFEQVSFAPPRLEGSTPQMIKKFLQDHGIYLNHLAVNNIVEPRPIAALMCRHVLAAILKHNGLSYEDQLQAPDVVVIPLLKSLCQMDTDRMDVSTKYAFLKNVRMPTYGPMANRIIHFRTCLEKEMERRFGSLEAELDNNLRQQEKNIVKCLIPGVEPHNIRQILLNLVSQKDPATLRVEPFFSKITDLALIWSEFDAPQQSSHSNKRKFEHNKSEGRTGRQNSHYGPIRPNHFDNRDPSGGPQSNHSERRRSSGGFQSNHSERGRGACLKCGSTSHKLKQCPTASAEDKKKLYEELNQRMQNRH